MKIKKKDSGWWIIDENDAYGPYDTKADAESDARGIERFYRNVDNRRFFTTEKSAAQARKTAKELDKP
jgi:hypothetical protein